MYWTILSEEICIGIGNEDENEKKTIDPGCLNTKNWKKNGRK